MAGPCSSRGWESQEHHLVSHAGGAAQVLEPLPAAFQVCEQEAGLEVGWLGLKPDTVTWMQASQGATSAAVVGSHLGDSRASVSWATEGPVIPDCYREKMARVFLPLIFVVSGENICRLFI